MKTIENVLDYWGIDDGVFITHNHQELSYYSYEGNLKWKTEFACRRYTLILIKKQWYIRINPTLFAFDLCNGNITETIEYPSGFSWDYISDDNFVIGTIEEPDRKHSWVRIKLFENKILDYSVVEDWFFHCSNKNYIVYSNFEHTDITCISTLTFQPAWKYKVEAGKKIFSSAKMGQNCVCVCVCDDSIRNSYILGLDINSGKLMWQVSGGWFEVFDNYAYTFYGKYLKSIQIGKIDTATGKKEEFDLTAEFIKYNVPMDAGHFCIADNYLYMSLHSKGYVIVLNLLTMQIEEAIQIPITEKAWQIQTPQVSGNKLFVLDQGNTLHIYERE